MTIDLAIERCACQVYTHADGKDTNRAAQFHGNPLVWRMALHHGISTPHLLERRPRDRVVALLSWRDVQLDTTLI